MPRAVAAHYDRLRQGCKPDPRVVNVGPTAKRSLVRGAAVPSASGDAIGNNEGTNARSAKLRYTDSINIRRRLTTTQTSVAKASVPTGKIKSFGAFGPKYQVGRALRELADGDWLVDVTMVETGEHAEYRLARVLDHPEAR